MSYPYFSRLILRDIHRIQLISRTAAEYMTHTQVEITVQIEEGFCQIRQGRRPLLCIDVYPRSQRPVELQQACRIAETAETTGKRKRNGGAGKIRLRRIQNGGNGRQCIRIRYK